MLYVTADHGGYNLKTAIMQYFEEHQIVATDLGPYQFDETDNYPDNVKNLIFHMKADPESKGIIICRNGVGVSMMCNRFKGFRAALSWQPKHAVSARNDDNTNILALPADYIDTKTAIDTCLAWLSTDFSHEKRHYLRVDEVERYGQE